MLSNLRKAVLAVTIVLSMAAPDLAQAGVATPVRAAAETGMSLPGVELVAAKHKYTSKHIYLKPGCRAAYCSPGYRYAKYRKWQKKKYFGRVVAGVALGVVVATAANATPYRPENDLCWYWTNNARNRGYWDYCY